MNCDRCGKKIKYGTLCHDCNIYLESYCKGLREGMKDGYNQALYDVFEICSDGEGCEVGYAVKILKKE